LGAHRTKYEGADVLDPTFGNILQNRVHLLQLITDEGGRCWDHLKRQAEPFAQGTDCRAHIAAFEVVDVAACVD